MVIRLCKTLVLLLCLSLLLISCSSTNQSPVADARKDNLVHDYSRSFGKTMKLAVAGNAEAQYALGYMYYYGLGVAKDQDIARVWIIRAANQSYSPAILAMRKIYKPRGYPYYHSLG